MATLFIISILIGVLFSVAFLIFVYIVDYFDIEVVGLTFLIFFMGFSLGMLFQFFLICGSASDAQYQNTDIDNSFYSITITHNIENINNEDGYIFDFKDNTLSSNEISYYKDRCFFIPWDEKEIVLFDVLQKQDNLLRPNYRKAFIYVPKDRYTELVNNLSINEKHCLDKTFIDPLETLKIIPITKMQTKETGFTLNESKNTDKTLTDTKDTNVYTTKLIESKPIFKYDLKNGVYTIRYNDGTLLEVNSYIVEVKTSNEEQMYIDKILVVLPDATGEETSFYKYEIYK